MKKNYTLAFLMLCLWLSSAEAQALKSIDKVIAVVGDNIVLQSDVDMQYAQLIAQGTPANEELKCYILQQILTQKLLAQQGKLDSVDKEVKGPLVDEEIDRRMRTMIQRAGGEDRLEEFLGRSVLQYKEHIRPDIREQLIAQKMQAKITEKITLTPQEIRKYYETIPKDSLPNYSTEVELRQIVIYPKLNREEKQYYKDKLESIRLRIKTGENFGTLARLYSQDPGSAREGGDLGFMDRSNLVKEFAANAFKIKPNEFSPVFETDFGFHFLQVTERKGEQVRARHILIRPEPTEASMNRAKNLIDSIYQQVMSKKIDFSTAASSFSDDNETKFNGGTMINLENVQNRSTHIPVDKLDPQIFLTIDTLQIGSYSKPTLVVSQDGKRGFRFFYLKSKTAPHQANLEQDLPKIKDLAYEDKVNRTVSEWFEKRRKKTFIDIRTTELNCDNIKSWDNHKKDKK